MEENYRFGEFLDELPSSRSYIVPVSYRRIWNALDNVPNDKFLPVIWKTYSDAFKFAQACKSKRIGKPERPNMYSTMQYSQIDNIVYVRGMMK